MYTTVKKQNGTKRTPMERRKHGNRTKLKIVSIWGAVKQNRWELNGTMKKKWNRTEQETGWNGTGKTMERGVPEKRKLISERDAL